MSKSIYQQIGKEQISKVIHTFYERAFIDPLIGHFFFKHSHDDLVEKQITFSSKLLGAESIEYTGKPLTVAHNRMPLTNVHFNRRQTLMKEVLEEAEIDEKAVEGWLAAEERLRNLIVNSLTNCKK